MAKNFSSEQYADLHEKLITDASAEYDRFKSDREDFNYDDNNLVADGMYRCFRNSDLADTERSLASDAPENRASVGSVRFFRLVNQKAYQGDAVTRSGELPFRYTPISNPNVFLSADDGKSQAAVHNCLAKYTWKRDQCRFKMVSFWNQAYKYSNIPVQITWKQEKRRVLVMDQKTKTRKWKEMIVHAYPSWKPLPWSMVYADLYAGPIEKQKTVIVLTIVPWMDIQSGIESGYYDKEQVAKLRLERSKFKWDGMEGAKYREEQVKNDGADSYSPGSSDLYLQWDIYQFAPVKDGQYDEENDYDLIWTTAIGNSLAKESCVVIRCERDFDPDNEIPILMVNAIPDDADLLYHMSWAQTERAFYSIECTLWEDAIDNNAGINDPPIAYDSAKLNMKPESFKYEPGAKWDTQDPANNIKEFQPRDTLQSTTALIRLVQEEQMTGASGNKNMSGEEFGGRTPASEGLMINRYTQQPNVGEVAYILYQLLPWLARKYKSHWQGFGDEDMIKMIADESLDSPVYVEKTKAGEKLPAGQQIYGDFDIEVDILDEFMDDMVQARQELDMLRFVGQSQPLQKSDTHRVDVGFWMRDIFRRMKIKNASSIIQPSSESDGHLRQREELRYMAKTGRFVSPQQGEDHTAHIAECEATILEYKPLLAEDAEGLEDSDMAQLDAAKTFINMLVIPHRDAHRSMREQANSAAVAPGSSGTLPAQSSAMTPGQMAGAEPAAVMGAAMGGV